MNFSFLTWWLERISIFTFFFPDQLELPHDLVPILNIFLLCRSNVLFFFFEVLFKIVLVIHTQYYLESRVIFFELSRWVVSYFFILMNETIDCSRWCYCVNLKWVSGASYQFISSLRWGKFDFERCQGIPAIAHAHWRHVQLSSNVIFSNGFFFTRSSRYRSNASISPQRELTETVEKSSPFSSLVWNGNVQPRVKNHNERCGRCASTFTIAHTIQ